MSIPQSPLELWGGVECTINRVRDTYFDQLGSSGHRNRRASDLDLFARLGISTLRVGFNWEDVVATRSWQSLDDSVAQMERLGIRPIAGLLHHGSGPASTSLLDPGFPEKLAAYALQVAERYPSILDYTPVNEPQTTGRFSCLYGHWFPHHRDMRSYLRALLNQIKAIALSMTAVRSVQPLARLIHTEDGGHIFSTPRLESFRLTREQRSWLGTDLLCGLVTRQHPLFPFLLEHGLSEPELLWFTDHPCPPDILGLNYYVTSDRFLDHRLDLYPPQFAGGDTGAEPLVDIEAIRVRPEGIAGVERILTEAWDRYRIPLAITEAHLGCDSDEQLRWLFEVWQQAQAARASGADVRAVTVWALLGSFNWCHLVTQDTGAYEPGVFDLADPDSPLQPSPTPLAGLVSDLAHGRTPTHPVLSSPGWWHHPDRITIPPYVEAPEPEEVGV